MAVPAASLWPLLHGAGPFSWTRWEIHASVLAGCGLLAAGYLAAVGLHARRGRRAGSGRAGAGEGAGGEARTGAGRVAAFLGGLLVLFLALNGPLHDLSDRYLFSAHMVQHLLLTMAVPPLLLLGTPPWLLRPVFRRAGLVRAVRFVTRPLVAFAIYNVVFTGWHFPGAYNLALENHDVHIVQHLSFIGAALLMWWPIAGPAPEVPRAAGPVQVLYIFALGLPMSIVAAFITFSGRVVYPWYEAAPRVFGLSALDDQRLGGLIMWVPGMLVFWIAMTVVFFRWARQEERQERAERSLAGAPSR